MNQMQKQVDEWTQGLKVPYWQPLEILARLTEETGELAKELNIRFGAKKKKPTDQTAEVEDEIGDILFTVACLANSLDLDLDRGFQHALDKCYGRDKDLHEKVEKETH